MPMNRSLYPKDWDAIATAIKQAAGWTCQNCGRPCRKPSESWDDFVDRLPEEWRLNAFDEVSDDESGEWGAVPRPQRFTLTVAHLNHKPEDCRPENLRAWCSGCHCRYDAPMKAAKAKARKRKGQLDLFAAN